MVQRPNKDIVALGQTSGKEVKLGTSLSMDWVLAKVAKGELVEYVGIEVQSIEREIRFQLEEFSRRFVTGANLPSGEELDNAVRRVLGKL